MPEYLSGRKRKQNIGINSYSENTDSLKVVGNILVSSGRIGVGTTTPEQDVDVDTIRIRETLYDYNNFGGSFGYFLTKDESGVKWVEISPIDTNSIFVAENNNILGVSSFIGLNIVSDELLSVSPNSENPNFADIVIIPRWARSGDSGIYTTKNVGIGTTIPTADFQVGFGTTGVTIDGSVGIVSAIGYFGEFADFKNLIVGLTTIGQSLNVIGLGGSEVSAFLASAGGITTTGGDLYVGGQLFAGQIEIGDLEVENVNASGIVTAPTFVGDLTGNADTADYSDFAGISTYADFSGISTNVIGGIASVSQLEVSGISTISELSVIDEFDVYASDSVFHQNVVIQGNLTVNGTEVIINVDEKFIKDKQIVLGFSTTNSVDDDTANGGGFAIASTEGSPLVSLYAVGVNTLPDTYKKLIWAKANTYGVGTTDAFMFNYAVGIGSTLVPDDVRLAVGGVQITDDTVDAEFFSGDGSQLTSLNADNISSGTLDNERLPDDINISGIMTALEYFGTFKGVIDIGVILENANYAKVAGIATYAVNAGISTYADTAGISTYAVNAGIATYAINAGVATYAVNAGIATYADFAGISTYADSAGISTYSINAGIATYADFAGISTYADSAGISTYSINAGIATYSDSAGISTYAVNAGISTDVIGGIASVSQLSVSGGSQLGIVTATEYFGVFKGSIDIGVILENANYAKVAGVATYAVNAGVSTYSDTAGISTYAVNAGIATNVIGGIGSITSLTVSGVTTTNFLNVGAGGTIFTTTVDGNVGIGSTLPQYEIDVLGDGQVSGTLFVGDIISRGAAAEEITRTSSGILSTTSLNKVTVDQFDVNRFRSAKYLVQITTNNSLGLGTAISVKTLSGGTNYNPGVFSEVYLNPITGVGTGAVATLTVIPEFILTPTSCSGGVFTISGSTAGITTGQSLYFNENLSILPLEQSKLTQIQLNSSGFGYTSIPTISIQAPIITSNPVQGVGVGSTAIARIDSMIVQDFDISVGIATTTYPTVTISGPSIGTTATGIVGVGVSQISIVNVGSGYTVSPSISISKVSGFSGSVGLGISDLNWEVSGGSGFTTTPTITITGENSIGIGASIEADVDPIAPNGLINFRITNVGSGYTSPPAVSITGDGVGAGVTIATMVVTDVTVNNIGSGSTTIIVPSDIVFSPVGGIGTEASAKVDVIVPTNVVVTNVGSGYTSADFPVIATFSDLSIEATVGLGVELISLVSTGIGYTVFPDITFDSPTLGFGSTATASSTKLGYDLTTLFAGPGIGVTSTVYYITPLSTNTFAISQTIGGSLIDLGYSVSLFTTRANVGGKIDGVDITTPGSGYKIDDVLSASSFDTPRIDSNVGVGFSFLVNSTLNNFQISEVLVLQTADSGNQRAYFIENAGISDVVDLGDFETDISGDNARLRFIPKFADNTIKFYRTVFTI
jgi:hypothetical protein